MAELPPELLDNIVDEVQNHRKASIEWSSRSQYWDTLRTCILVSKAFRYRALKFVYSSISLYNAQYGRATAKPVSSVIHKLRNIVDPPPSYTLGGVGAYIKTVSLSFATYGFTHPVESNDEMNDFLDDENLLLVLRKLCEDGHRVNGLILNLSVGFYFAPQNVAWDALSPRFRTTFLSLAKSSHLRSLEVKNVTAIPLSFLKGSHLNYLYLQQNAYDELGNSPPPLPSDTTLDSVSRPQLRIFGTDHSYSYKEVIPSFLLENLESLETTNSDTNHVLQTWDIVKASSRSLKKLKIIYFGDVMLYAPLELDQIPGIENFSHIHNFISNYSRPNDPSLVKLCKLLDGRAPAALLQCIYLGFKFKAIMPQEDFIDPRQEPQWGILDRILAGPMYPSLRQVVVEIRANAIVAFVSDFDSKKFISITVRPLRECFPKLSSSKSVSFKLKVDLSVDPQD